MPRRVFFSFHYDRDIWRANVVRNSRTIAQALEAVPRAGTFFDASLWEEVKRRGGDAIRRAIDEGLEGTTVTAVLIGLETATRRWVRYEIDQSHRRGNGLVGVYINMIPNQNRQTDPPGHNPLDQPIQLAGGRVYPAARTYDWFVNNGYVNFPAWVEEAARQAGR